ncbi:hypothetical protein D3C71_1431890 [compost metagenome]
MEKRCQWPCQWPAVPVRHRHLPRGGDAHRAVLRPVDRPDAGGVQLPVVHDRPGGAAAQPAIRLLRGWRRPEPAQRIAGARRRAAIPGRQRSVRRARDGRHRRARPALCLCRRAGARTPRPVHRPGREGGDRRRQRWWQEHPGAAVAGPLQRPGRHHPLWRCQPAGNRPGNPA